jgi:glycosyltransferase involved in cell wall biosynthesis
VNNLEQNICNVIHVIEDISYANFGVSSALVELVAHFPPGYSCVICTVNNNGQKIDPRLNSVFGAPLHKFGAFWRYSSRFESLLKAQIKPHTLIHIHGLWMAPQYQAAKFAIKHNIPFIITPHNMLGGWLWSSNRLRQFKKILYFNLISRRVLSAASVIHALTEVERDALRPFFPKTEIAVIPNGISLDMALMSEGEMLPPPVDGKYVLFLGRLHPVKGLDILLMAMSKIPDNERITLIVAGGAHSTEYEKYLKGLVSELGLSDCVRFVGLVSGAVKWSYLKHAWALCAPSHSEGMSMVALEGMASATPLLTTYASGFVDLEQKGAGLLSKPDVVGIGGMLQQAFFWSNDEQLQMGNSALEYVRENYSWDRVSTLYGQLYARVMGVK